RLLGIGLDAFVLQPGLGPLAELLQQFREIEAGGGMIGGLLKEAAQMKTRPGILPLFPGDRPRFHVVWAGRARAGLLSWDCRRKLSRRRLAKNLVRPSHGRLAVGDMATQEE